MDVLMSSFEKSRDNGCCGDYGDVFELRGWSVSKKGATGGYTSKEDFCESCVRHLVESVAKAGEESAYGTPMEIEGDGLREGAF